GSGCIKSDFIFKVGVQQLCKHFLSFINHLLRLSLISEDVSLMNHVSQCFFQHVIRFTKYIQVFSSFFQQIFGCNQEIHLKSGVQKPSESSDIDYATSTIFSK